MSTDKSPQPPATKPETTAPNEVAGSTDEKHSFNWGWIVWPLVVLVLYVLSVGPVFMLAKKGVISSSRAPLLDRFFSPVVFIYQRTFLHKPFGMYLHLWSPENFDKHGDTPGHPS